MKTEPVRPTALILFVQSMAGCAMLICAATLVWGGISLVRSMVAMPGQSLVTPLILLIAGGGVGGCLLWLLTEFVLMCGRVRRQTAFTAENVRALGRIVLALVLGGLLLIPLGKPLMDWLLLGMRGMSSPLWWGLPTFAAFAAALLVRAIQVLMHRAVEMQTEQDLTV